MSLTTNLTEKDIQGLQDGVPFDVVHVRWAGGVSEIDPTGEFEKNLREVSMAFGVPLANYSKLAIFDCNLLDDEGKQLEHVNGNEQLMNFKGKIDPEHNLIIAKGDIGWGSTVLHALGGLRDYGFMHPFEEGIIRLLYLGGEKYGQGVFRRLSLVNQMEGFGWPSLRAFELSHG